MSKTLDDLAAGDFIASGHSPHPDRITVERVTRSTPTQLVVSGWPGRRERQYSRSTGYEIGTGSSRAMFRTAIRPATRQDMIAMARTTAILASRRLIDSLEGSEDNGRPRYEPEAAHNAFEALEYAMAALTDAEQDAREERQA